MPDQPARPSIDPALPDVIDTVAMDLACSACGYNLRNLNIFIEPHTKLTVIRCPECGTYQPTQTGVKASLSNLNKIILPILSVLWMLFILWVYFASLIAEIVASIMLFTLYHRNAPAQMLIPAVFLFASPMVASAIISAASTSPKTRTAVDWMMLKTAIYAACLIAFVCFWPVPQSSSTRFNDGWIDTGLILVGAVALHTIISFHAALFARPIAVTLSTHLLPRSAQHAVLKYWNLTPRASDS